MGTWSPVKNGYGTAVHWNGGASKTLCGRTLEGTNTARYDDVATCKSCVKTAARAEVARGVSWYQDQ